MHCRQNLSRVALALLVLGASGTALGQEGTDGGPLTDAAADAATDAAMDGSMDGSVLDGSVPGDAGTDAIADGAADAGSEAATDAGGEGGGPDAGDAAAQADAGAGPDAGPDAGPEGITACSCEVTDYSGGPIHLCTGSFEDEACRDLECSESSVRHNRCDEEDVLLCCDVRARGTYVYLYNDCTHANCETGFRAQCDDFGGTLYAGLCPSPQEPDRGTPPPAREEPDPDEDDSPFSCSVGQTGFRFGSWLMLGLLGLFGLRRRQRL
jgi:MYXO-CTERM domain-containing protein